MVKSKYGAKRITAPDGEKFDSMKEYNRYCVLKLLQRAGKIRDLQRQVKFVLIPKQEGETACTYVADFTYWQNGEYIVEDVKGYRTDVYKIKRKLMKYLKNITILET